MHFVFISDTGATVALSQRVKKEGHAATICAYRDIATFSPVPADIFIVDNPVSNDIASQVTGRIIFTSSFSRLLANSPDYQRSVLRSMGLTPAKDGMTGKVFTVEGWFNGDRIISQTVAKLYYHLFAGNLGPKVDCTGAIVWGKFTRQDPLFMQTLGMMEKPMRKIDYRGPVSLDIVIQDKGVYVYSLHAYPRDGLLQAVFSGTKTPVSDIMRELASAGKVDFEMDHWMGSALLSIPPYPYAMDSAFGQVDVDTQWINSQNEKHFWICGDSGTGRIGYVTARGKGIRETRRRIYRTLSMVDMPMVQYRNDIGMDMDVHFKSLVETGLCPKLQIGDDYGLDKTNNGVGTGKQFGHSSAVSGNRGVGKRNSKTYTDAQR